MRIASIRVLSLSFLAALLVGAPAGAQDHLKKRARWEWSLPESKQSSTFTGWVTGGLTIGPGKLEKDRTRIGQWKAVGPNEVQLNIDSGPLAGTSRVKLTKAKPPTYEGELVHKDGKKEKVVFELYED